MEDPPPDKKETAEPRSDIAPASDYVKEKDDKAKLDYLLRALSADSKFGVNGTLDRDLLEATEWAGDKTREEIMSQRECTIHAIEALGQEIKASGRLRKWLVRCIWAHIFQVANIFVLPDRKNAG